MRGFSTTLLTREGEFPDRIGAGTELTGPVEIEAVGSPNRGGLYDAFWDYRFINIFKNGLRFIGTTDLPRGVRFEGAEGWLFVPLPGPKLEASNHELLGDFEKWKQADGRLHRLALGRSPGHYRDFLDAVKTRRAPVAPAEVGHRTASICHLNNLGIRLGRKLVWDPDRERFPGDAEANALIWPAMRPPWILG